MKTGIGWMRGGVALAALFAGLAAAQAGSLKIESWRNDDADIWNTQDHPGLQQALSRHQGRVLAVGAEGIQRRAQRPARRRHRRRSHHLPAVRRLARPLQEAPARQRQRSQGHGQLLRRRQGRLDDRRRQDHLLRADGLGHPRLHLQQGRLQEGRRRRSRRRWTSSTQCSTSSRRTAPTRRSIIGTADQWEAATMGFQNIGPNYWKGETGRAALIAGKEKFTDPQYVAVFKELANWAPYMGNGFQAQTYPDSQNLFSLGKARDLSRRLVGHLDLPRAGASSRWAPSRRRCRPARRTATSPTTPTSRWASTPRRRTRTTPRSSWSG